jgi:hypothetical protein
MIIDDAVDKLTTEFGTAGERKNIDKIVAVIAKVVGKRNVPDAVLNKVIAVGRQLKALGIA